MLDPTGCCLVSLPSTRRVRSIYTVKRTHAWYARPRCTATIVVRGLYIPKGVSFRCWLGQRSIPCSLSRCCISCQTGKGSFRQKKPVGRGLWLMEFGSRRAAVRRQGTRRVYSKRMYEAEKLLLLPSPCAAVNRTPFILVLHSILSQIGNFPRCINNVRVYAATTRNPQSSSSTAHQYAHKTRVLIQPHYAHHCLQRRVNATMTSCCE